MASEHPAQTRLAGQIANGYRIEVTAISTESDPEEIKGNLVDSTDRRRPAIPFELDTYQQNLIDPTSLQKILQESGRLSDTGSPIRFRFA